MPFKPLSLVALAAPLLIAAAPARATEPAAALLVTLSKVSAACTPEEAKEAPRMTLLTCGLIAINHRLKALGPALGVDLVATVDIEGGRVVVSGTAINGPTATAGNCDRVLEAIRADAGFSGGGSKGGPSRYTAALLPADQPATERRKATEATLDQALAAEITLVDGTGRTSCAGLLLSP